MNKVLLNSLNKICNKKKNGYNNFNVLLNIRNIVYDTSRNYKKRENIFYKSFIRNDYSSMSKKSWGWKW